MNAAILSLLTPDVPGAGKCSWPELARFRYRAAKHAWSCNRGEIAFLRRQLRPGQVAVDIGAHKGAFTFWMRKCVGPAGSVIAFEPQLPLARRLASMAFTLGWENVHVEACAASDHRGISQLLLPTERNSPGARLLKPLESSLPNRVTDTPTITLDDFFSESERKPDFIKCDCEGHEAHVLEGAARLLRARRPVLLLELEARHMGTGAVTAVFDKLRDLGYRGWFFHRTRLLPLAHFDPARHQQQSPGPFWKSADYCNNFAFVPLHEEMQPLSNHALTATL